MARSTRGADTRTVRVLLAGTVSAAPVFCIWAAPQSPLAHASHSAKWAWTAGWGLGPLLLLLLGDTAALILRATRPAARWAAPLLPLLGAAVLLLPAAALPRRARKQWLGDGLEALSLRQDHGFTWCAVLLSFLGNWPSILLHAWRDHLAVRPDSDLDLATHPGCAPSAGYWKRHRTEILWAAVFAALLAVPAAVGYEMLTEFLHHHHMSWPWETGGAGN
ncbi:hypothetical protein ACFYVL_09625 [Streptomyces sp. NPDC004111]|uniref:hypothetical protein n=1 Tax=Streptomyces sp. NPDC004111 TaxID=3364690 RepID=UPI0036A99CE9